MSDSCYRKCNYIFNLITNNRPMKTRLLFSLLLLAPIISITAQNLIAVQNGGVPSFYTTMDAAITNSVDGDTIYIPGGVFSISVDINKRIHIFGVGHNSDSSFATNISVLTGNITLSKNASGGSLSGVKCTNIELSPGYVDTITNYSVSRCNLNMVNYYGFYLGNKYGMLNNCVFIENVIRDKFYTQNSQNNLISNNIISGPFIYFGTNNTIRNNIFLQSVNAGIIASNIIIENNIFLSSSYTLNNIGNSILNNNLLVENTNPPFGTNLSSNNVINQAQSSIFINQTGNTFDYSHDYHLQQSSPGKNAGRDGTDIGIYGGAYPWKGGSIPINPHFQTINIAPKTDASGNLNVIIKVAAQDR